MAVAMAGFHPAERAWPPKPPPAGD